MKKIVVLQIISLAATAAMGATLKFDLLPYARLLHRSVGMLAGFLAIVTVFAAFNGKQPVPVKTLSILALLLTVCAAIGGKMAASDVSYGASYGMMIGSGVTALVLSIVMLVKVRTVDA